MLKKILSFIIFILVVFAAYLLYNTLSFKSKQVRYEPVEKIGIGNDPIHHLAEAIRIKTISTEDPLEFDSTQFKEFVMFLQDTYPLVETHLKKTSINTFSYVYKWEGKNKQLKPVVLVAHLDVVPVPKEDLNSWMAPPYDGKIMDGTLYGRGTMDDKVSVIGIMEAVEYLLHKGFQPERTVYLAFGHDEEVGGQNGAQAIVQLLKENGVQPEFVLDEGLTITQGLVPGVLTNVALIGIAEKGFASLSLSINLEGGHSSMPNNETAIEVISRAITRLENNPFPAEITKPVQQFIEYVGPEMRFQEKLVFANNALFRSAILGIYQQTGPGRALVQTTMAPTVFNSGIKENVIPTSAKAIVNFRVLPGSTISNVIEYVKSVVDDNRIIISLKNFKSEPSMVSGIDSDGFKIINQTITEIFPDVITVPNLVLGATDGRYYGGICEDIYRFLPIRVDQDNISAIHGINESIPVDEFDDVIRFYVRLMENCK